ncbi:hypothetical protein STEG23_023423 [Scotinomys teguina]
MEELKKSKSYLKKQTHHKNVMRVCKAKSQLQIDEYEVTQIKYAIEIMKHNFFQLSVNFKQLLEETIQLCVFVLMFVHKCKYSERPKEGTEYPGAGIVEGYEWWEPNWSPLQE